MISTRTIIRSIIFLILLLILPNFIYLIFFFENPISKNPNDWAQFATYFGGFLNPIIAIFGTIILGYLSIQIGKQSSDENKNLFILEQKILAYQQLAKKLEVTEIQMIKTLDSLLIGGAFDKKLKPDDILKKSIESLEGLFLPMAELQSTLNNFPIIYGHLFKYNFEDDTYTDLIKTCEEFTEHSKKSLKKFPSEENGNVKGEIDIQKKFINDFKNLLKELKTEIT